MRRLGEVLADRYRLTDLLDAGGQGAVYGATDEDDGQTVAVKVFHVRSGHDHVTRARMLREAEALAALRGTGAVDVRDHGWTSDGAFYLVTELLRGRDLDRHLTRVEEDGGRIPVQSLPGLLGPVARTLALAHERGMVHRDVKPSNVFLAETPGGIEPRLLDFGYVKLVGHVRVTDEDVVLGSPSYIAPEAWLGDDTDARADVYSLGVLAFRLLAGAPPFTARQPLDIMRLSTSAARPSLSTLRPGLPPAIDVWVERALAVDPRQRYENVRTLFRGLVAALGMP